MGDILTRTYRLPADKVFLALIDAAQDTFMKIKKMDAKSMRLEVTTGMSLWSYGEKLDIQVSEVGSESVVYFKSSRRVPTNITADTKGTLLKFAKALDKRLNP